MRDFRRNGIQNHDYSLAPLDSLSAIWAFNDDRWNDALLCRMLIFIGDTGFPVEFIDGNGDLGFSIDRKKSSLKKTFLKWGVGQLTRFLSLFVKRTDALIVSSYLPAKELIKLQLSLSQFPLLHTSKNFHSEKKPDLDLRKSLASKIRYSSNKKLEVFLTEMLFYLLPVCYLEAFEDLNRLAKTKPWPKNPKFIFTSNSFDTDEIFKISAASKVEVGCKYFTGQHGNNYGTYRYMNPSIEEITADKFLTWGWIDGYIQHVPAFILKTAGIRKRHYNRLGGLLLIQVCLGHRVTTWDIYAEFYNYFEDQYKFISELSESPKDKLVIRLHSGFQSQKWFELDRWRDFDATLNIEPGNLNVNDLISKSRLVIYSYDSTGILESLSQNIPTLAFWQNGLDHLRETAKPYYQLLVDVGIVHFSPESASAKTNDIWDDVDSWWFSGEVQNARELFCDRFARVSDSPIADLKKYFGIVNNL
ncbi:LIC12162 family protein [Polynucleobacter sp. AM-26B4]|uniref:LIC12162 family transferase n=1 Tax=Polynucleobacter sp. AM-26B4 TaxID=2689103 RepID=UPI001C0D36CE|nr:LIC12162 family protein [Polynucleobacter sp. AM-26B4]MBU3585135.1 transferase [Polynucleobacter sp. AM-26B4]